MNTIYDVVIAGGGPAGLSAAMYAARANLKVLIIERDQNGGQINLTAMVENYPGGLIGETGIALTERMVAQCKSVGVEFISAEIMKYSLDGDVKRVNTSDSEISAKAIILATGRRSLSLDVPGEKEFVGRGVSYCATCDGPFFSGANVVVVGGGDSAIEEAIYLTKFARKVTVIHRRDALRAAKSLQDKAFANDKIEFLMSSRILDIFGGDIVEKATVQNLISGDISTIGISADDWGLGVFVFIGHIPNTEPLVGQVELENGYIITDEEMRTNIPGVFAAGDVRKKTLRQIVTAAADGAIAAVSADNYIGTHGVDFLYS